MPRQLEPSGYDMCIDACAGVRMCPMGTYECTATDATLPGPLLSDTCTKCAALPYTPCRRFSDGACVTTFPNTAACPVGSSPCPGSPADLLVRCTRWSHCYYVVCWGVMGVRHYLFMIVLRRGLYTIVTCTHHLQNLNIRYRRWHQGLVGHPSLCDTRMTSTACQSGAVGHYRQAPSLCAHSPVQLAEFIWMRSAFQSSSRCHLPRSEVSHGATTSSLSHVAPSHDGRCT
jgi:hypothetical protein